MCLTAVAESNGRPRVSVCSGGRMSVFISVLLGVRDFGLERWHLGLVSGHRFRLWWYFVGHRFSDRTLLSDFLLYRCAGYCWIDLKLAHFVDLMTSSPWFCCCTIYLLHILGPSCFFSDAASDALHSCFLLHDSVCISCTSITLDLVRSGLILCVCLCLCWLTVDDHVWG